jgi:quercetin dioxygenase-like cupin family protein
MPEPTGQRAYLQSHNIEGDLLTFELGPLASNLDPGDGQRQGVALVKEAGLNIVLTALAAGSELAEHTTRGGSSLQVLSGRVEVRANDQVAELGVGSLAAFNAGVPHAVRALEDAAVLVTVAMPDNSGD